MEITLNAVERVRSIKEAQTIASIVTLVRTYFPSARANLSPWRDDPLTRYWSETESLDLSFHFPGWSPSLQCRSFLMQLRFGGLGGEGEPIHLLGVLMRGLTFDGERWRLATVGDWQPVGSHPPHPEKVSLLRNVCRDLFELCQ